MFTKIVFAIVTFFTICVFAGEDHELNIDAFNISFEVITNSHSNVNVRQSVFIHTPVHNSASGTLTSYFETNTQDNPSTYATLLAAITMGKKVDVYFNDIRNSNGYYTITSVYVHN